MSILARYVISEFLPPAFIAFFVFTMVLVLDKIFELVRLIITRGVEPLMIIKMLLYCLPSLFVLSIPMAILTGILISLGRLSGDNEITAIRSSGISFQKIFVPLLSLALLVSLLLIPFNNNIAPKALFYFHEQYTQLVYKHPLIKLDEHTFIDVNNYKIYLIAHRFFEKLDQYYRLMVSSGQS